MVIFYISVKKLLSLLWKYFIGVFMAGENFEWDKDKGELRYFGKRLCIHRVEFIVGLKKAMANVMGEMGAKAVLRRVAKAGGLDSVQAIKDTYGVEKKVERITGRGKAIIERTWILFGYGAAEFKILSDKEFVLTVKNSYESSGLSSSKPMCYITEGFLEGVFEGLFGKKVRCRETKCIAMGDEYCEFRINVLE